MSQDKIRQQYCSHTQLVNVGPDLYQCQTCGAVIEIIQARILTEEFALTAMAALFPDFRQLIESEISKDNDGE